MTWIVNRIVGEILYHDLVRGPKDDAIANVMSI